MQSRILARMQSRDLRRACWIGSRVSRLGRPPWAVWADPRAGTSVSHQQRSPLACITASPCLSSSSRRIKVHENACIWVALACSSAQATFSIMETLIGLLLLLQEMHCRAFQAELMTSAAAPCQCQLASLPPSQGMRATCLACWSAMCWQCIILHQTLLLTSILEVRSFAACQSAKDFASLSVLSMHEAGGMFGSRQPWQRAGRYCNLLLRCVWEQSRHCQVCAASAGIGGYSTTTVALLFVGALAVVLATAPRAAEDPYTTPAGERPLPWEYDYEDVASYWAQR